MPLSPAAAERASAQLEYLRLNPDSVIDADTHISNPGTTPKWIQDRISTSADYFHGKPISAEELVAEMDAASVDMALCWQNPAATEYPGTETENFKALLAANQYIFEASLRYPERIIPAGWTDPKALGLDGALEIVERCITEFGFPIVKINPAQNEFPIDSDEVFSIVDRIYAAHAIPAFHFGADTPYTPPEGLERLAQKYAPHPLLAIHMGGGGASYVEAEETYTKSREIGLRNPNIRYILSAKRDTHMESDLIAYQSAGSPFTENLMCASDAPYGRQSWNFGGFRAMFETLLNPENHSDPRLRSNPGLFTRDAVGGYLGRNFARLMVEVYEGLLS